jgi:hypothetical protein
MTYRKKENPPRTFTNTLAGRLYSPDEAGDYLGIAPQTLAHWRVRGTGPQFIHLSKRCIRYSEQALREWLDSRTIASTVER